MECISPFRVRDRLLLLSKRIEDLGAGLTSMEDSEFPLPKRKSRSHYAREKENIKYETGPSGGRAPRTRARAREDQAEGLPFLLVCLSISSFQYWIGKQDRRIVLPLMN